MTAPHSDETAPWSLEDGAIPNLPVDEVNSSAPLAVLPEPELQASAVETPEGDPGRVAAWPLRELALPPTPLEWILRALAGSLAIALLFALFRDEPAAWVVGAGIGLVFGPLAALEHFLLKRSLGRRLLLIPIAFALALIVLHLLGTQGVYSNKISQGESTALAFEAALDHFTSEGSIELLALTAVVFLSVVLRSSHFRWQTMPLVYLPLVTLILVPTTTPTTTPQRFVGATLCLSLGVPFVGFLGRWLTERWEARRDEQERTGFYFY